MGLSHDILSAVGDTLDITVLFGALASEGVAATLNSRTLTIYSVQTLSDKSLADIRSDGDGPMAAIAVYAQLGAEATKWVLNHRHTPES